MKIKKEISLSILGIFFLGMGLFSISLAIIQGEMDIIFWFCYIGWSIIGYGILTRNSFLIISQLNILTIPTIIWNIDFFYYLFTKKILFGITSYFFSRTDILANLVSIQHIYSLPLAFFSIYLIKTKRKDFFKLSLIQIFIIFILSKLLTQKINNVNCVFKSCMNLGLEIKDPIYSLIWFISYIIMIIITNFIIIKINLCKAR